MRKRLSPIFFAHRTPKEWPRFILTTVQYTLEQRHLVTVPKRIFKLVLTSTPDSLDPRLLIGVVGDEEGFAGGSSEQIAFVFADGGSAVGFGPFDELRFGIGDIFVTSLPRV